jgi:hypothetical protein
VRLRVETGDSFLKRVDESLESFVRRLACQVVSCRLSDERQEHDQTHNLWLVLGSVVRVPIFPGIPAPDKFVTTHLEVTLSLPVELLPAFFAG